MAAENNIDLTREIEALAREKKRRSGMTDPSQHIQQLEQNAAAQQQMVAALQQEIAQLHQKNADLQARSTAYETSLENVFSSKSWKLTAPIRSLMRLFHRGN